MNWTRFLYARLSCHFFDLLEVTFAKLFRIIVKRKILEFSKYLKLIQSLLRQKVILERILSLVQCYLYFDSLWFIYLNGDLFYFLLIFPSFVLLLQILSNFLFWSAHIKVKFRVRHTTGCPGPWLLKFAISLFYLG